jgi:hypothetical protein
MTAGYIPHDWSSGSPVPFSPLWSGPNFVGGQLLYDALPPNHDMSPAPAERYVGHVWPDIVIENALEKCPHCGKPLSE